MSLNNSLSESDSNHLCQVHTLSLKWTSTDFASGFSYLLALKIRAKIMQSVPGIYTEHVVCAWVCGCFVNLLHWFIKKNRKSHLFANRTPRLVQETLAHTWTRWNLTNSNLNLFLALLDFFYNCRLSIGALRTSIFWRVTGTNRRHVGTGLPYMLMSCPWAMYLTLSWP